MLIVAYLCFGIFSSSFAYWSWRLAFKEPVTLGTVLSLMFGILIAPLSFIAGIVWLMCWLIQPDQKYIDTKWPDWYGRLRYKQHKFMRKVWHLRNPPKQENLLSDWARAPERWKS